MDNPFSLSEINFISSEVINFENAFKIME